MVILLEKKGFVFHIDPGPSPVGRLRRAGTLAAADVCIVCNREFLPHFPAQGKRLFGRQGRRMRRAEKEREGGGERRAGQSGRGAAPGMTEEAVCAGKLAGRNGVQEKRKPCVRSSGERGAQKNRAVPGHQRRRRRLHVGHILFALRPCGAGVRGSVPACLRRSICRGAEHQKARQGQNGEKGRLRMSKDGQAGAFIMTSGRHTVQRGPCAGGRAPGAAPGVAGKPGARWPMRRPKKWKSRARGNWCGQVLQGLIRLWKRRAGRGNRSSAQGFACRPEEKVMRTGTAKGRACLKRRMERDPCGGGRNGAQEKRKPCVRSSGERGAQKNRAVPGHQRRRRRLHVGHILFALRPCGAGVRGSVPACLRRSICRGAEHQKARQGQNGEKGRLRMSKDGQAGAFIMTSGRHTVQRGPCAGGRAPGAGRGQRRGISVCGAGCGKRSGRACLCAAGAGAGLRAAAGGTVRRIVEGALRAFRHAGEGF